MPGRAVRRRLAEQSANALLAADPWGVRCQTGAAGQQTDVRHWTPAAICSERPGMLLKDGQPQSHELFTGTRTSALW